PNMAGLSSILWQGFPEVNNMRIVRALREAGSIAATPNDRIGYGIPDLKAAFGKLLTEFATSSNTIDGCKASISWKSKDVDVIKYEIKRKGPADLGFLKVGELNPTSGVSLTTHNYSFNNKLENGSSGNFLYRIKQIIDTAVATFTAVYIDTTVANVTSPCVITALVNPGTIGNNIIVRPNPSVGA